MTEENPDVRPAPPPFVPTYEYQRAESQRSIIDAEHLRLLRIGYFISAGQTAFLIPFGLMYAGMGVFTASFAPSSSTPGISWVSWIMGIAGAAFALLGLAATALKIVTAIRLKERRSRVLCMVTAGISCLEVPYGTALGVMTFIVLSRPSVRQLFDPHH
jgi:hypothetical protein